MRPQVGVDIGSTSVRVVELAGLDKNGYHRIRRIGVAPLADGLVVSGRIREPDGVAYALNKALTAAGVTKPLLVAGVGTPETAVQRTALPLAVPEKERLRALRLRGKPVSPAIPLDTSVLGVNQIGVEELEGQQNASLVLAAALRAQVGEIEDLFRRARLELRAVDLAPAACMRAVNRLSGNPMEVATVVDVGASKIAVTTRQGPHLRSVRVGSGGGDSITKQIIGATGATLAMAELQKSQLRLSDTPASEPVKLDTGYGLEEEESADAPEQRTPVEEVLVNAVEPIIEAIGTAIDDDANTYGGFTQSVTLCGGSSLLRGFREALQARLGVPVYMGSPWATIEPSKRNEQYFTNGVEDPALMLTLATAVGLAAWQEA